MRLTYLGRHDAALLLCDACGLLQAAAPHWLDEAYSSPIAAADTGLLQRNIDLAPTISNLFELLDRGRGLYVDVAGGTGVLTRLLRDRGFDARWDDPYAEGELARGAHVDRGAPPRARVLTAIEVLEHVTDPLGFLRTELSRYAAPAIICTTELYGPDLPDPSWWYFAPMTGQHISFFQSRTLRVLAESLDLRLYSRGWLHLFCTDEVAPWAFRLATGRFAGLLDRVLTRRRTPLTMADHERLLREALR